MLPDFMAFPLPFFAFLVRDDSDDELDVEELDDERLELLEEDELEDVVWMTGRRFFFLADFLAEAEAPRLTGVEVGAGGVLLTIFKWQVENKNKTKKK